MIIALDFSMSTPAMCLTDKPGITENTTFHYLTDVKKKEGVFLGGKIIGILHNEWQTQEQRFDFISNHFLKILITKELPIDTPVFIEDYSMGSKGRVFAIAENTGLMKYKLWKRGHEIICFSPSAIKKAATGKGNAKKPQMYEAFIKETKIDLSFLSKPDSSPCSDIVDSYWIAQLGFKHLFLQNSGV